MKSFFKTSTVVLVVMALVLGFQYVPLNEILPAKAQTVRMLSGPLDDPYSTTYLTPTSNTLNTNLPTYALPGLSMPAATNNGNNPVVNIDVNADGLLDLVHSYWTTNSSQQFVILNTGDGYNLVYVCYHQFVSGTHTYKGDCAQ